MKKSEASGKSSGTGKTVTLGPASPERPKKGSGNVSGNSPSSKASSGNSPVGSNHNGKTSAFSGTGTTVQGMKHSKSDHSHLSATRAEASPLGKKFISKSQENLSSQRKARPLTISQSPRPRSNAASIARAVAVKNKEGKSSTVFAKPKPVKGSCAIRKASSTQSIDRTSLSASSAMKSGSSKSSNASAIKRAQSTQNICKDKFSKKRTSAPADVMAYNAELLANFEKDKKLLEVRISELAKIAESRKGEVEKYKYEIKRLRDELSAPGRKEEVEVLRSQNRQLLDRLQELGFPAHQSTDTEKLMLKISSASGAAAAAGASVCETDMTATDTIQQPPPPASSSSPSSSVMTTAVDNSLFPATAGCLDLTRSFSGGTGLDLARSSSMSAASEAGADLCMTPDHPSVLSLEAGGVNWDKQSCRSANSDGGLSEASVACLTERILQMEETNYSTAEELQATLQELGDLQDAVNELTEENTKLTDEKTVLLESLCTQTEKLENTRIQLEQLKYLLISGELPNKSDRDGHLLGLLKSAAEEREELMRKQTEWSNALESLEVECRDAHEAGELLRDKYNMLEEANSILKAERDSLERQLHELRESQKAEQFEVVRVKTLLEQEKNKVCELERERGALDQLPDMESVLASARQDKVRAEQRLTELTETLGRTQCDLARVRESLATREQELAGLHSSSKSEMADLHLRLTSCEQEKQEVERKETALRQHIQQLEADCHSHIEDKQELSSRLQQVEGEMRAITQQRQVLSMEIQELNSKRDIESEEWKQFQKDLQTAVVIANNFSQDAQEKMEKLTQENALLQDRKIQLESEVEKLHRESQLLRQANVEDSPTRKPSASCLLTNAEFKGKVLSSMAAAAHHASSPHRPSPHQLDSRSQTISVKALIRSMEEQVKSGAASLHSSRSDSRRSSLSSQAAADMSLALSSLVVKSPGSSSTVTSPMVPATPENALSPTRDFGLTYLSGGSSGGASNNGKPQISATSTPVSVAAAGASGERVDRSPQPRLNMMLAELGTQAAPVGSEIKTTPQIPSSILKDRSTPRRSNVAMEAELPKKETPGKDPLASLAKLMKGSKRNALLKWCQLKTIQYANVDITNFSSSWNDGLAFCALLHNYVPDKIPYSELNADDKRKNFTMAFNAGESVGIKSTLNINEMVSMERPDWQAVMGYVTNIYKHFEVDNKS